MKKILLHIFCILGLLISPFSLFAQKEEFQKFEEASNLKQRGKALEWIAKAYQKAPTKDSYRYWYARELHRHQKYREALNMIEQITSNYRRHEVTSYRAKFYEGLGLFDEAIALYQKGMKFPDTRGFYNRYFYSNLLELILETQRYELYKKFETETIAYHAQPKLRKRRVHAAPYVNYRSAQILQMSFFYAVVQNKDSLALQYSEKILALHADGFGKYSSYFSIEDFKIYRNAFLFWQEKKMSDFPASKTSTSKILEYRILTLFIKHINLQKIPVLSKEEKEKFAQNPFPEKIQSTLASRDAQKIIDGEEILKRIFFYLTEGKLLLTFQHEWIDAELKDSYFYNHYSGKKLVPIHRSITPYPIDLMFRVRNEIDTYFFVYPKQDFLKLSVGGVFRNHYVPYLFWNWEPRGKVSTFPKEEMYPKTLIHELMHNVLQAYNLPSHHYYKSNKKNWNSWYLGEGELVYYQRLFQYEILPKGLDTILLRNKQDAPSSVRLTREAQVYQREGWENLKKMEALGQEAEKMKKKERVDQAIQLYLQAYKKVPDSFEVVKKLALLYLWKKKDYQKAQFYFEKAVQLDPNYQKGYELGAYSSRKLKQ